jgi:hypothetical protein
MVSHESLEVAVQLHPAPALTATTPVVAVANARFDEVGEIENVQGAPAWLTVNVWPPIVIVPVRESPVLAATLYVTVPFPVPVPPDAMVIHGALVVATQLQLALAVTPTVPLVAADVVKSAETGEIVNVHGAPAWVTVKVCPAIVIVPLRDVVSVFTSTL